MRTQLAEKLLVKIMGWSPHETMVERPLLQALANFKYDEYQQFSSGTRFIESLVKWLRQFDKHERHIAYDFIKKHLIFISHDQMVYLVNLTFTDRIDPHLIAKSVVPGTHEFQVKKIVASDKYGEVRRRSLFIGLSDGARMDQLRRGAGLNNEQVLLTYEINDDKAEDLLKELKKDNYSDTFTSFFLIDDFTASGTSYFRKEDSKWKGKVWKTLNSLLVDGELQKLVCSTEPLEIRIIFYIATKSSMDILTERINQWKQEVGKEFKFTIEAVQTIDIDVPAATVNESSFINLAKKYFDDSIVDDHFKKAKHAEPYLGYNECALPLILVHNTPNNSLPLLWLPDDKDYTGLFPRVTRHKSHER